MEIQLADALKALRQELSRSIEESEGEAVRFRIEKINLEAQVAVTAGREGGVGVKIWLFSGDGKTSKQTVSTHTLTLELAAETADGDYVRTGAGRRPAIPLTRDSR
ncbi:trypco2 family protein [Nonomuraea sp. NPDC004354]